MDTMNNMDLTIENYDLRDIVTLFQLPAVYGEAELQNAWNVVLQIRSLEDTLSSEHTLFFTQAYKLLRDAFQQKKVSESTRLFGSELEPVSGPRLTNPSYVASDGYAPQLDEYSRLEKQVHFPRFYNSNTLTQDEKLWNSKTASKIVTIHSEDRDVSKWPRSEYFEVQLPETIRNVICVELIDMYIPGSVYNISQRQGNNTLMLIMTHIKPEPFLVTLDDGTYDSDSIASSLETTINQTVTNIYYEIGAFQQPNSHYTEFSIQVDPITSLISIVNRKHTFELVFDKDVNGCSGSSGSSGSSGTSATCGGSADNNYTIHTHTAHCGLGYILGFEKTRIVSQSLVPPQLVVNAENEDDLLYGYQIVGSSVVRIDMTNTVYMEIDGLNHIDEIVPYSKSTNSLFNNDYQTRVQGSFAKLIVPYTSTNYIPQGKFLYTLPIMRETIQKIKVKFRYHNNQLAEFKGRNLNFALRFSNRVHV